DALVVRGAVVRALELRGLVGHLCSVVGEHRDEVGRDLGDDTGLLGGDDVTGVDSGTVFHAGAHYRGLGNHQRHRLTLHVRTHEGAGGVVVREERDPGRCRGHQATCGGAAEV